MNFDLPSAELLNEHRLWGFDWLLQEDLRCSAEPFRRQQRQRNLLLHNELGKLTEVMRQQNVTVVALKGLSLLNTLYQQDWGQRAISDIDVFVDPKNLSVLQVQLSSQGYQQQNEITFSANNHKEVWIKTGEVLEFVVEIHTRLFAEHSATHWKGFDGTPRFCEDGLYRFPHELELTYLISHLAHQHSFLKLFWLIDIDLYSRRVPVDWATVKALATVLNRKKALDATLFALSEFFDNPEVPFPENKRWHHLMTWSQLLQGRNRPLGYYLLKHALKDSVSEALAYDFQWLVHQIKKRSASKS